MRLLTLNTHSLVEPDYEAKRKFFVDFIAKEQPDVFALQEVNQTATAPAMSIPLADYCPCSGNGILLKEDNHAAAVAQMLKEEGVHYTGAGFRQKSATTSMMKVWQFSAVCQSLQQKICC